MRHPFAASHSPKTTKRPTRPTFNATGASLQLMCAISRGAVKLSLQHCNQTEWEEQSEKSLVKLNSTKSFHVKNLYSEGLERFRVSTLWNKAKQLIYIVLKGAKTAGRQVRQLLVGFASGKSETGALYGDRAEAGATASCK